MKNYKRKISSKYLILQLKIKLFDTPPVYELSEKYLGK